MKKRSHRQDKFAKVYDEEILPIWAQRFGRMMLHHLELPPKANVLDVCCGTGYPSLEILRKMDPEGRIIAIDASPAMLDVARGKAGELSGKRIFFRSEQATPRVSFANDVFDLVISNLGLTEFSDPADAISEFARVCKPGGRVVATLPLQGSWAEFYDIYREVLTKHDKHETLRRLEAHVNRMPDPDEVVRWIEKAGLTEIGLEVEQFTLLFKSSREFFFAPVIEYGPLSQWKEVAGRGQEMQDIFWFIKEAIDAYFGKRAFTVTVLACCLRATKPRADERPVRAASGASVSRQVTHEFVEVNSDVRAASEATGSVLPDDDLPIEDDDLEMLEDDEEH
jgi:ubiquinone/menaquinone biosynthesis C-methylase UbiE